MNGFNSKKEEQEINLDENRHNVHQCTKPSNKTTFEIPGFTLAATRDMATMSRGVVAILVKNYTDCTEIDLDIDNIYHHHHRWTENMHSQLLLGFAHKCIPNLNTLSDLLSRYKHTIVLGDFNAYHLAWGHQLANVWGKSDNCATNTT